MKRVHSDAFGHAQSNSSGSVPSQPINVMFLCEEWISSKGGLPTFNREFAISLAKISSGEIIVHCYVSRSSETDREDARKNGVNLITAKSIPGSPDPLDWLKIPPPELSHPDIVIGHGRKFGPPAYFFVQTTNCKWVQFVHVFCEDLGKYKQADENTSISSDTIEENEKKHKSEIQLCKAADAVVAVGRRLQLKYKKCLPDKEVHVITPGILEKFTSLSEQKVREVAYDPEEFSIFVIGRGTFEDLALKGYDIIADAVGSLGEKFKMTFVGSPEGQHRKIEDWLLQTTKITRRQVTIRGYCSQDELKTMFCEADLVALPSRTEGFGLVALEAISAGVPVLVTSESGIAKALEKVEDGHLAIVQSEKPEEWIQKITQLSKQKVQDRCDSAIHLRDEFQKTYSWDTQCEKFKEILQGLYDSPSLAGSITAAAAVVGTMKRLKEIPSVPVDVMSPMANVSNLTAVNYADNNGKKECQSAENKERNLLHSAAEGGDVSVIETMLSLGFDVNSRDSFGTTPLILAAAKGNRKAVDFLISKGANPSFTNNKGRNLLHAAVEGGDVSIVEMFLPNIPIDSSDSDGVTSLMIAASSNNLKIVNFLLSKGADPLLKTNKGNNVLFISAQYGHIDVIEQMCPRFFHIDSQDDKGCTPLMCSAAFAKLQAVNYLLENGADPLLTAKNGWSLLHYACQGGNTTIVESILSCGLEVDIKDTIKGLTPLMVSVVHNNQEAIKYLLEKGADPSLELSSLQFNSLQIAVTYSESSDVSRIIAVLSSGHSINMQNSLGQTALMVAAFYKKPEVVDFLLHEGADPFLIDTFGRSVLHHASEGGHVTIIDKFLSLGLNLESEDIDGNTPLMMAISSGNAEAVQFLLQQQRSSISSV